MPWLFAYSIPLSVWLSLRYGGILTWWPVIYLFAFHPVLDLLGGPLPPEPSKGGRWFKDILVWLSLPTQAALVAYAVYSHASFGSWFAVGISGGGFGITAAHELIHRRQRWERVVGISLLSLVNYAQFRVEHVYGHHRWVATPRDPASARKNEGVYRFWWRSVVDGTINAWRSQSGVPLLKNRTFRCWVVQIAVNAVVLALAGPVAWACFLMQSLVAILLLETINYIEHYGLERKLLPNGQYEGVSHRHSWDSDRRVTNWTLFNLGLHVRHHLSASLPYEDLAPVPSAPRLPFGYSTALVLALIPPLWKRTMNPRVEALS